MPARLTVIAFSLVLTSLASAAAPPLSEFTEVLAAARERASTLRSNAQLYSIDSVAPRYDAPCRMLGWELTFFAKVGPDVDKSEMETIKVRAIPRPGRTAPCVWGLERIVSHDQRPTWGTAPLDEPLRGRFLSVAQAAAMAKRHVHRDFEVDALYLSRPDIQNAPAFTYQIHGSLCGGRTYVVVNAENGNVFDKPQPLSCPVDPARIDPARP